MSQQNKVFSDDTSVEFNSTLYGMVICRLSQVSRWQQDYKCMHHFPLCLVIKCYIVSCGWHYISVITVLKPITFELNCLHFHSHTYSIPCFVL